MPLFQGWTSIDDQEDTRPKTAQDRSGADTSFSTSVASYYGAGAYGYEATSTPSSTYVPPRRPPLQQIIGSVAGQGRNRVTQIGHTTRAQRHDERHPRASSHVALAVQIAAVGIVGCVAAILPIVLVALALIAFGSLRPRAFATAAIALSMLPLPYPVLGFDPRVGLVLLLLLGVWTNLMRRRLVIPSRLLFATGSLSIALTLSFLTTLDFRTVLVRQHDFLLLLTGLVSLVLFTSLRLPLKRVLHSVALGGATTAALVLFDGNFSSSGRLAALALNPNFLGLLLATTLVALLGMPFRLPGVPSAVCTLCRWLGASGVALALVLTQSRGAVLAAAIGLIGYFAAKVRLRSQAAVVVAVALLVLTIPGLTDAVVAGGVNRPRQELVANNSIRFDAAELAARYALSRPVTGVGYGTFPDRALRDSRLGVYINTHNDYLRLAAEAGLPALMAFIFLLRPVAQARRGSRAERASFALAVTYLVGLLFANGLTNLQVTLPFWAILGSMWAAQTPFREPEVVSRTARGQP